MFAWVYRYLPIIIFISLLGCKMSSTSTVKEKNYNKTKVTISGSKETGTMAAIAIGAVVGLEAIFAGPVCGASMNPARSIAPAVMAGHLTHLWLYIVATTLGAVASVGAYRLIKP